MFHSLSRGMFAAGSIRFRILAGALLATAAVAAFTVPVSAHSDEPSADGAWSWWVFDPLAIVMVLGLGILYYRGLKDWKKRSRPMHKWQIASFYAGITVLFIALVSPIDPLSDHLFIFHNVQHLLLRVTAPALILLGAPLTPVLRGLPLGLRQSLVRPLVSNPALRKIYRTLQNPVLVPALFLITLFFWALPGPHDAAVDDLALHYLMHLTMTSTSFLFWWLIIDPKPHRSNVHYGVRILIMALTLLPNTVLGAIITFAGSIQYESYGDPRLWGIDPLHDQRVGALIQWLVVDMMSLAVTIVIFGMWYQREQQADREKARRRALERAARSS
ncbi:MAG: cytochrome c oxidase assembly protein [Chloroflexi bacterium]|nr:cytochrome c oxidase assembly protein [Chloroflexota bacterium]